MQHSGEASAEQADNGLNRLQATLQLLDQVDVDTAEYVHQLQANPQQLSHAKEDPARSQVPRNGNSNQLPLEHALQSIGTKAETADVTEQSFRAGRQHIGGDGQHHGGNRQPVDDSGQGRMGGRQHPIGSGLPQTSSRQHGSDIGQRPDGAGQLSESIEQHADAVGQHALLTRRVSEPVEAIAEVVAHRSDQQGLQEILSESDIQHLNAVTQSDDAARQPTAAEHAVREEQEHCNLAVESSAGQQRYHVLKS